MRGAPTLFALVETAGAFGIGAYAVAGNVVSIDTPPAGTFVALALNELREGSTHPPVYPPVDPSETVSRNRCDDGGTTIGSCAAADAEAFTLG
jgi:hypothetical protein